MKDKFIFEDILFFKEKTVENKLELHKLFLIFFFFKGLSCFRKALCETSV